MKQFFKRRLSGIFRMHSSWNIGVIQADVSELLSGETVSPKVHWITNMPKDRFWADPFILEVEYTGHIRILVEEYIKREKSKGTIVELRISPNYQVVERWEVLCEGHHLSYPFIERVGRRIFVYPEASESGELIKYELINHTLVKLSTELELPICDATKMVLDNVEWWFGSLRSTANTDLVAYYRNLGDTTWYPHPSNPLIKDVSCARMAGSFIRIGDDIYRLAQNCSVVYGGNIECLKIEVCNTNVYHETLFCKFLPNEQGVCPYGIHTLNSYQGLTVVDGIQDIDMSFFSRLVIIFNRLKHWFKRVKDKAPLIKI